MKGGILVVDKPAGPTSFTVVERVRRAMGADKAGHTGTLDPAATGVLAVCIDDAVKLQHWITEGDKGYEALVAFGLATDTEDAEGREVERGDPSAVTADRVAAALPALTGELEQLPPMYSAVRVGGRRLHQAARAGVSVERTARRVVVHALELRSFEPAGVGFEPGAGQGPPAAAEVPGAARPPLALARLSVRCGKGTYVRSLATALGRALGVPAHLAALRRTASGPFTLDRALPLEAVERLAREAPGELAARLVPPAEALASFPVVRVTPAEVRALAQGKVLPRTAPGPLCRALDEAGALVAVVGPAVAAAQPPGGIRPLRVFVQPPGITGPPAPER